MTCTANTHTYGTYSHGGCTCDIGRNDHRLYNKRRREGRAPIRRVPVIGYRRRVQGMYATGWTYRAIGDESDMARQEVRRICTDRKYLSTAVAARVHHAYAILGSEDGPSIRSIRAAKKLGWAPSWAWDGVDIDNPHATPRTQLDPVVDEVLIDLVLAEKRSFRELSPAEKLACYRTAVGRGWGLTRIQNALRISSSVYHGLSRRAA